jgi:hypothetical protein
MSLDEWFRCIVFLALVTPIGWGVIFLIIYGLIKGTCKATKNVVTADYSVIPEGDKREMLLRGLKEDPE